MKAASEAAEQIREDLVLSGHVKGQGSRRMRVPIEDADGNLVATRPAMRHAFVPVDPADVVALTSAIPPLRRSRIVRDLHKGSSAHVKPDGQQTADEVWIKSEDAYHLLDEYAATGPAPVAVASPTPARSAEPTSPAAEETPPP